MTNADKQWILYVDDTEAQRYAMRRILESVGFEVVEVTSGANALELLHTQDTTAEFAAVILDVQLPDING